MIVQKQKTLVPLYLFHGLKNNTVFSECPRAYSPYYGIIIHSTGCA